MIGNFFRHLDAHGARFLLVSGQATILYGAATFSEDIDLWVEPSAENLERFKAALRASGAMYYKLTPPLTAEAASRHHGFHFTVPTGGAGAPLYLDLMGRPPRVGVFEEASSRARVFATDWGPLPTVAITDLVELKKTQRPRDYPIIGRLALAYLTERGATVSKKDRAWAADNVFGLTELKQIVIAHPGVIDALVVSRGPLARAAEFLGRGERLPEPVEDEVEDWFDAQTAVLRKADRHFWRPVIDDLRRLRAEGRLVPEGTPV